MTHLSVEGMRLEAGGVLLGEFLELLHATFGLFGLALGEITAVHGVEALGLQTRGCKKV